MSPLTTGGDLPTLVPPKAKPPPLGLAPFTGGLAPLGGLLPSAIASDTDQPTSGYTPAQQQSIYGTPVLGGFARVMNSPLLRSLAPSTADSANPLFALGPAGELAGPATEAAGALAGKVAQGVRDLSPAKAAGSFADALGQGVPQRVSAQSTADRYIIQSGKTRTAIRDTATGDLQDMVFTGKNADARAQARADQLNARAKPAPSAAEQQAAFGLTPDAQMDAALTLATKSKATPDGLTLGTVVRRTARANPDIVDATYLASHPETRAHLDNALAAAKMDGSDANAVQLAQRLLDQEAARPTLGNRNVQKIRAAVNPLEAKVEAGQDLTKLPDRAASDTADAAAGMVPKGGDVSIADAKQRLADQMGVDPVTGNPLPTYATNPTPGEGNAVLKPGGGAGKSFGRAASDALGQTAMFLGHDLPLSVTLLGHLPLLRQGLKPALSLITSGRPGAVLDAYVNGLRSATWSQGAMDAVRAAQVDRFTGMGMPERLAKDLFVSTGGPLSERESYTLNGFMKDLPVVRNLNQAFPTIMNSLRAAMLETRINMVKQSGQKMDWQRIADQVGYGTGRGPLLFDGTGFGKLFNNMLMGPRLLAAPWKDAVETLRSVRDLGSDVLSRKPLDPLDVAAIKDMSVYVAGGMLTMEMMKLAGVDTETNTDSKDWGRMILPDGVRVDLWGASGPDARLVAQTLTWISQTQGWGQAKRPQKYGSQDAVDMLENYLRGKLGPGTAQTLANVGFGKDPTGQPFDLFDRAKQMLASPGANLPRPIAVEQLTPSATAIQGDTAELLKRASLAALGAGVINSPRRVNYDGLGNAEGTPDYRSGTIQNEWARLAGQDPKWHSGDPVMTPPSNHIGKGTSEFTIPSSEMPKYMQAFQDQRSRLLGPLVNSQEYQQMTNLQKQDAFDKALGKADQAARDQYLSRSVVTSTDPRQIAAEAVDGFHNQQNERDKAYWVALLDRAGKLTPEVKKAIEDSVVTVTGKKSPLTVDEYLRAAPLVHEYLHHVPYGTDARPIGTPADWTASHVAHDYENAQRDALVRGGVPPAQAATQARNEALQTLASTVQRSLFLSGTAMENPARKQMERQFPTLKTFLGPNHQWLQEADDAYHQFPSAQRPDLGTPTTP